MIYPIYPKKMGENQWQFLNVRPKESLRQKKLDEQLIAGYKYLAQENRQLLEEFRQIDQENWEGDV